MMHRTVADAALIEAAQRIAPLVRACRDDHRPSTTKPSSTGRARPLGRKAPATTASGAP